jgi:G3E family GTPase
VDLDKLLNTDLFHFDEVAGSARWIEAVEADADEDEELGEAYEYGIDTFVYYRRRPFDLGLFDEFVARHWPKSVIRCKGMCYFSEEYDMCYLFEQAGKQLGIKQCGQFIATMPKDELEVELATDPQLRRDWDEQYGDRMQKLVFIGQNMDKKAITAALDACLV